MIEKLHNSSRTTEVDGSVQQTISGYNKTTLSTDNKLVQIIAFIVAQATLLSAAINRLKAKSEQRTYDDIRDEKITALYYLLLSFSHHPQAAIKNAALSLFEVFEHYGMEIKSASFTSESSLLNSMLVDYSHPKQLANIAEVPQCDSYIAALHEAQNNFESNRLSFEEAQGQEGTLENASKLKKVVITTINGLLVPYLNVVAQLDEPTYGAYTRTVAEIIAANNEQVKKRLNKGDKPEEGED
jgi:hypothetical protein